MRIVNDGVDTNFYQWDTGRRIIIKGGEVSCGEAHFHNKSFGLIPETIYIVDGQVVANVPDEMLQVAEPYSVYLSCKDSNGVFTEYHQKFSVKPRPRPAKPVQTTTGNDMLSDTEQISLLIETDMLPAVHDASGAILADRHGNVILRY